MGGNARGQTTLDFAFGMSIFIAVVLFIFLFVPGVLEPFTAGAQEETVAVDRVADDLSRGMLGSPQTPKTLNATCTVIFFDGRAPGDCRFSDGTTKERLGLRSIQNVNVTVSGNVSASTGSSQLCWDEDDESLKERSSCGSSDVYLWAGDSLPGNVDESVTARRIVSLQRETLTLEVVMW
jgi:hypothetical protein